MIVTILVAWGAVVVGFVAGAAWATYGAKPRQEAPRGLVVPVKPGRKRNAYHRSRQPRKRPRH